jgi:hypothetical protein
MSGFEDAKVRIKTDELDKVIKRYKKAKKFMKSTIFAIKTLDGTETYISGLIKEAQEDPPSN